MKYIIIYEDYVRTLVFKSDSKKEVDKWYESTINDIKESGGKVDFDLGYVAWGALFNGNSWKIIIYNDYEVDNLKRIGF